ncbi:MAG: hypothetical protein K2R98_10600 [Gemmataceae bacterium]|nr:hypothetical protein [Gemmataceae bacterium]
MTAIDRRVQSRREEFLAELLEAALVAIARHEVHGPSIDIEIHLWQRLETALDRLASDPVTGWEHRLAVLTRATYEVALEQGIIGPFLELELALWTELRQVVRNNRFLPDRRRQVERRAGNQAHLSQILAIR